MRTCLTVATRALLHKACTAHSQVQLHALPGAPHSCQGISGPSVGLGY